jgi:hypothetical protein
MTLIGGRAMVPALTAVIALVGCGPDHADGNPLDATASDSTVVPERTSNATTTTMSTARLAEVTGELVVTRQRDLLDRGLINVLTRNRSDSSMVLDNVELVADFFLGEPAAPRTISVRGGRQVAIQVPYGVTVDCDTDRPVAAALSFTYRTDTRTEPRTARIELDGTGILDEIRSEQCLSRRFDGATSTRFDGTRIVDGTVVTDLVIAPVGTSADLAVSAVSGTVLVGVRPGEGWAGSHVDEEPVSIPLTFVVNRCDPHALAEVTKRYGLDLSVSSDGDQPVAVGVDVTDLVDDLDAIVGECIAATAGG